MRRSLKDETTMFFINMGKKNKLLKIPAVIGLAVSMVIYRIIDYCKRGTQRFASVVFILLCFMVGNSFAYPVFQDAGGFVSEEAKKEQVSVTEDSDISFVDETVVEYDNLEILEDEDVLNGYDDAELHGMDEAAKYSLDEILEEGRSADGEEKPEEEQVSQADFKPDDWRLVLINKQHPIPDDYTFTLGTIKTVKGNMQCDERIIEDLLSMMQAAKEDGVTLAICSPYRDLNRQEVLFNRKIEVYMNKGMSYMEAYKLSSQAVTVPGASEHQIGLAIDIVSDSYITLDEGFADTDAGKWLAKNSCYYGFILRYPKGKEFITSIEFEPWHFRYVGKEAAEVITKEDLTLEEFWERYL